jgi:hypothetical protein
LLGAGSVGGKDFEIRKHDAPRAVDEVEQVTDFMRHGVAQNLGQARVRLLPRQLYFKKFVAKGGRSQIERHRASYQAWGKGWG